MAANNRRRKDLYTLPLADQDLLEEIGYKQKMNEVDDAIIINAQFLSQIVASPEIFGHGIDTDEQQQEDDTQEDHVHEDGSGGSLNA